ncbi:MAG: chemotaxis protein CheA [Acidobacteriaceae bacterium]
MKIDLSQFRQAFLQESAEHTSTMESGLLALRSAPDDIEILNAIFRSAHSIKGGAGSFGLESLVRFTHALEDLLDRMRAMEVRATEQVIAVLLESIDVLRSLLERGADGILSDSEIELVERIEAHATAQGGPQLAKEDSAAPSTSHDTEPPSVHEPEPVRYKVDFRPKPEMFSSGTNPIVLLRNLTALAQAATCELHTDELPPLSELDPERCYLSWTVDLITVKPAEELREVFEFVDHIADISIRCIDAVESAFPSAVTQMSSMSQCEASTPAPADRSLSVSAPAAMAFSSSPGKKLQSKPAASTESSSIRVATDKVDRLIDLVGELVIAHVMTAQMVENFAPECLPRLRESVAAMERNTRELHERVMAVRMLPVGTLFQRYARIVYDIAQTTGKQITLDTDGEDTEIDKSMLELLGDPLTHLIRNAADHGIETAEARLVAGKPEHGAINLRAFHRSGRVVIEVSDDGAGIDPARVRNKAVERGLIVAGAQLSDDQLRMLIFEPGFSTRDEVSDLSGRGVGMDVVKQNVQRLSGTVSLSSEIGMGSTVSIELPLTLAILEGLLVRVADRTLVLPLLSVVETVAPSPGQMQRIAEQGEVVVIRDESVPLIRMRRYLGLPEQAAAQPGRQSLVVIVENGSKKIGLVVDELLGQQQVVVKSLERHLHKVDGLMGATILGDGCVAPIIDVAGVGAMNLFSLEVPINVSEQLMSAVQSVRVA